MPARVMIAALKSGSGKTTITCGLLECLKRRGQKVSSFKCGPDYIDPMFHRKVIGVPSHNLDTFFSDEEQIKELYVAGSTDSDISVVEGVMGLFDGLGGIRKEGSSYHLAQTLKMPIILVVDAHGMGRTIVPVLSGVLSYDTDHLIKGVILNQTSKSFMETIKEVIESELEIPVVGYVPKMSDIKIDSRHLGLKMPDEIAGLRNQLSELADRLEETINVDKIIEIAEIVDNCEDAGKKESRISEKSDSYSTNNVGIRIAVAMDEAFNFYYDENLRLLEQQGAEIVYFSPLHDESLPSDIAGIILGGGYPELKARELSENISMKKSIKNAIEAGIPSIAECGGFMYLHESIKLEDGTVYPMVGVVKGESYYAGKLVRFGYIDITEKTSCFMKKDAVIKAHEFHYFDSTDNGDGAVATKPISGKSWDCIHIGANSWWGYPHLYLPSNPDFVEHFVNYCIMVTV